MKPIKIRASLLTIDHRYQRELDEPRARQIAKEFDPDRVGVLRVSRRTDGKLVVLDGQHRVAAMKLLGRDRDVYCLVHDGLSLAQEAEWFLKYNDGHKAVRRFDKFAARLVAKEPVALEIQKMIEGAGLKLSRYVATGRICAIEAVEYAHGKGVLPQVLEALSAWDGGDGSLDKRLIRGAAVFFVHHPEAIPAELGEKLETFYTPIKVLKKLRASEELYGGIAGRVLTFRDIYNHKRGKGRIRPPEPTE